MRGTPSADASDDAFLEAYWHGEAIGDGGDPDEALRAYLSVRPQDGDWVTACSAPGAEPHLARYASFDAYLDNADALATLPVTAAMIAAALAELPASALGEPSAPGQSPSPGEPPAPAAPSP